MSGTDDADDSSTDEAAQTAGEQANSDESDPPEAADEAAGSDATDDEQPAISEDEQAVVPDTVDIDPDEIEEETADDADEDTTDETADDGGETSEEAEGMAPEGASGGSPVQAGELYVTLVQQVTNGIIRSRGGADADEVDRDHFEEYDLSRYFNETMEAQGVGSDLEPHEALFLATALSVGEPVLTETDVMDEQIGQLMDKAVGNGGAEA